MKNINPSEYNEICAKYIFEGESIYFESIMFVKEEHGGFAPVRTLYAPDKIIAVQPSDLNCVYTENIDYIITPNGIIPAGNTPMPYFEYGEYYLKDGKNRENIKSFPTVGGHLIFGEGDYFHKKQVVISYLHRDLWTGPQIPNKSAKLPKIHKKVTCRKNINILFNGDSITTGANSSGCKNINVPPYTLPFFDMFANRLENRYNIRVNLENIAVGGTNSSWGIEQSKKYLYSPESPKPDLYIIAFGMNDGSGKVPISDYISNIKKIISDAYKINPECEFIVIASMLPNPILPGFAGFHLDYEKPLLSLENEFDGVATANITEIHKFLLTKKRYQDMTGNNVNHPNDFFARIYAQVLLKTFGI